MWKLKLKFLFILLASTSIMVGSGNVGAVVQDEAINPNVNSRKQHSSEGTKIAIPGMGIILITGGLLFCSFLYRKRRVSRFASVEQRERYHREEFECSPKGNHQSSSKTNIATVKPAETVVTRTKNPASNSSNFEQTPTTNDLVVKITPYERYQNLITEIVATALKGQIRSKEYIYRQLEENANSDTNEIFERCLNDHLNTTQSKLDNTINSPSFFERETPELKRARLSRTIKALQSIQAEWDRFQTQKRSQAAVTTAVEKVLAASASSNFSVLLEIIDHNQNQVFSQSQLKQLAKELTQRVDKSNDLKLKKEIQELANGISRGIESYENLNDFLVRWIYEPTQVSLGFGEVASVQEPWATWERQTNNSLPKLLFHVLANRRSAIEVVLCQSYINMRDWVELAVILQSMQRGLVNWFEKQPFDSKWGISASIATFLSFAIVWCELSNGFHTESNINRNTAEQLAKACFQIMLQILRTFSHCEYFPLYGGVFASFGKDSLQDTVKYLDTPLREVEGTQEKARILTLLGYSQRILGKYKQAESFHQEALEIARIACDQACEIANLNHKSHICIAQKEYSEAINYSQRALILARQTSDRLGEAHALVTLGCSEVFAAQQLERIESDIYERAIEYLQKGLQLSEKLGDSAFTNSLASHQIQALCYNSLGLAYFIVEKLQTSIDFLEKGTLAAQYSGDKYLQGLNFLYLAESQYNLNHLEKAVYHAYLAMYFLHEISAIEWRQAASLLIVLLGKVGDETLREFLANSRNNIIKYIGVDGYDYLSELLEKYKRSE